PVTGALIVVTPQYVAHLDARKAVRLYQRNNVPVLGSVENMGPMACPHCGQAVAIFPDVPPSRSIRQLGVEPIGSIPFDPSLGVAGDSGRALVVDGNDSAPARAFRSLAETLVRTLG